MNWEDRLMGWRAQKEPSIDVETQGVKKQVLQHAGPQAVILILDQELVGL
jgi:hypothetical protein